MQNLRNKKAIITGAANGIGRHLAKAFISAGAKVWAVDNDISGLESLQAELYSDSENSDNLVIEKVDLTNHNEILTMFEKLMSVWGGCHILINNAGISRFNKLIDCEISDYDEIIAVNLRAPFILSREFSRFHIKGYYGRIINITSTRFAMSEPDSEAYASSKGGLVSLTHALAVSLSGSGITVNCISPGWINTNETAILSDRDHLQHPAGRVGVPDDIARVAIFLCQEGNDFIDGEEIRVDGGMTRKMIYE